MISNSNRFSPAARSVYEKHRKEISEEDPEKIYRQTKRMYKVSRISDKNHPAFGQYGLFAAAKIPPRTLILDYCGYVHTEKESDIKSSYDLRFLAIPLDIGDCAYEYLSIDAAQMGSEARFVNDYRGILTRPNVEFRNYRNERNEINIGVFSLAHPIHKGTELCVTYGKGFWSARSID